MLKALEEKRMRRFVIPLLFSLMHLSFDEQIEALNGAEALMHKRGGVVTPDAARLYARLPEKREDAETAIRILYLWVRYIEDGTVDYNESVHTGVVYIGNPAHPPNNGDKRLRLVS